jgi:hypothetical protein
MESKPGEWKKVGKLCGGLVGWGEGWRQTGPPPGGEQMGVLSEDNGSAVVLSEIDHATLFSLCG